MSLTLVECIFVLVILLRVLILRLTILGHSTTFFIPASQPARRRVKLVPYVTHILWTRAVNGADQHNLITSHIWDEDIVFYQLLVKMQEPLVSLN